PTRQLALLRLTLARAAAEDAPDGGADAAEELERAAQDAAASDAPELEYICRTALGEVHETGGRPEPALESVRLAVVAERRHRSRAVRFRAALAATPVLGAGDPATGTAPRQGSGTSRSRTPVGGGRADVERDAPSGTVPSPDRPDRAAAGGSAPAGSAERTAVLRSVQAPERAVADGAGADVTAAGAAGTGVGTNPAGPRVDRVNGSGVRPDGATGTEGNGANGHASRRPGTGTPDGGVDRTGVNGGATNSRATHAPGCAPPVVGPDDVPAADEAEPPVTVPMNPWASGVWTAGPPHPPEKTGVESPGSRVDPPVRDVPAAEPVAARASVPDPVASALADPEAWLASALADLDRIWGRRPEGADDAAHDDPDPPAAAGAPPVGCVVVLDLTRGGGERLPAEEVASTVRRVARRLAQELPESAHLLRDRPDAVSVVLADGDRVAAAEWMHRVVPALVDGLAADAAVEGAHLRAAVHDAQGVVGAQVLQRLEGGRTRSVRDSTPGRARHAAPGDITTDTTRDETSGPAARDGDDTGTRRASEASSDTAGGGTIDGADDGPTGSGLSVSGGGGLPGGDAAGGGLPGGGASGGGRL
ncbi:MAG: hypothetical protein L0I24_23485, partial [Pseudonocardia sp.]|nr:hypothetical protein [Pseudonocardia sp.]